MGIEGATTAGAGVLVTVFSASFWVVLKVNDCIPDELDLSVYLMKPVSRATGLAQTPSV